MEPAQNRSCFNLKKNVIIFRLAAASNIVVITPFFFYSKGDQKDGYRVPITSKLVGSMLKKAGATHLMLLDPHTPQVEGFFDLIIDTLKVYSGDLNNELVWYPNGPNMSDN